MSESEKTAIAAHLYVSLRRKLNRVIDVEWLMKNQEYAREVIALARQGGLEELAVYTDRLEVLMFGTKPKLMEPVPLAPAHKVEPELVTDAQEENADAASQYIGSLR